MHPVTFGILAHVDAGKTTLSEQLLYATGAIRKLGRVDHGDTVLDHDEIERQRGITVFSDQAWFDYEGQRFTLIDTPGHADFSPEAERAFLALDMAVLMVDGGSEVQAHTVSLFGLAGEYQVPTLFFINKTDSVSYNPEKLDKQIGERLTKSYVEIVDGQPDCEQLAMLDDAFCEKLLLGEATTQDAWNLLRNLFCQRRAFPLVRGAALHGKGVTELLNTVKQLSQFSQEDSNGIFDAFVYKIRRDENGEKITYLKIRSGKLNARAAFSFDDTTEKVHQIRLYRGDTYTLLQEASTGDAIGVTGLTVPKCGDRIGENGIIDRTTFRQKPVLMVRMEVPQGLAPQQLMEKLHLLEEEEPMLYSAWDAVHACATLQVMGSVQTEVLSQILFDRFHIETHFLPPLVLYKETLRNPVIGCGHYEPLRHYAEVHVKMEPAPRGSGISFESKCHVDDLPLHFQNLIATHVFEKARTKAF